VGTAINFAVGVAGADIGQHDSRQGTGVMELLAPLLDAAFISELA